MNEPKAYWLIGVPGSGKSTWTKRYLDTAIRETVVISRDALVEEWAADHSLTYSEAFEQLEWSKKYCAIIDFESIENRLKQMFSDATSQNKDVIIDMTNMSKRFRLGSLPKNYRSHGIVFNIDKELLHQRLRQRQLETGKYIPKSVVSDMMKKYRAPNKNEFDEVTFIDQE